MTSHAPISGTFLHFAARWVDPALGFALGWDYWYSNAISTPVEITAATIYLVLAFSLILLPVRSPQRKHQAVYTAVSAFSFVCRVFLLQENMWGTFQRKHVLSSRRRKNSAGPSEIHLVVPIYKLSALAQLHQIFLPPPQQRKTAEPVTLDAHT
ncbi:hypothetical protein BC835DRAFT_661861 [Cytidiella melzeri]|nr:hypothetical protein BC835DRAFT_661861 [Cytidiella melzeri]